MELSPGKRKAAFALIVLVLAGLGIYLAFPRPHSAASAQTAGRLQAAPQHPHPPGSGAAAGGGAAQAGGGQASPQPGGTPGAAGSASPSAPAGPPDIYQWLPFSQSDLARASAVVTQFATAYGTWSYKQDAAQYTATMNGLATSQLTQSVAQGYSVPGVASTRASGRQMSAGTAVISQLRAFGPSSLTFVVMISQQITAASGSSHTSGQYAVTVAGSGSAWLVNDIELASAGNP